MTRHVPLFIPVDNAAQIFISINSKKETTMSRIAIKLKTQVDKQTLSEALQIIIGRFPYYQVQLKKRFFSYVFKRTDAIPPIEDDTKWTNRYVDFEAGNFPLRVKVLGNIIAVELSHILSDGHGTMSFLLSLVAEYFRIAGYKVGKSIFIKKPGEEIVSEEWECAFRNTFNRKGPALKIPRPAYIPSGEMIPVEKYYSTRIIMDLKSVKAQAKEHGVTLNIYMATIYAYALQEMFAEDISSGKANKKSPIRLQIPVNLRKDYPTLSLRNFSYIYSPSFYITDGLIPFDELLEKISTDIRHEIHHKSIENQIARNLRAENNILFRLMPRTLKKILFKIFYHLFARRQYSGVLTNLGDIKLPEELLDEIESFDILPCNSPVPGRNTSLFSYKGKLEMNIGSSCNDLRFENKTLKLMHKLSIENEVIYKRDNALS